MEALHTAYAIRTLDAALSDGDGTVDSASSLATGLLGLVHLQQPNSVVMMSSTANLPVTIVNDAPVDVKVSVSAQSGATSLSISGSDGILIASRGEQQVTLALQAYSSGSSYVELQLHDSHDQALGSIITVGVSNSLRLNDGLGNAIIVLAIILAVGGLWRQFHRKPVASEAVVASGGGTDADDSPAGGTPEQSSASRNTSNDGSAGNTSSEKGVNA